MLQSALLSSLASLAISFLATPALSAILPRQSQDAPTAQVLNGTYSGLYSPEYNQDFFLGMPYSQPPVGDLRFRVAQSLNTSWAGTKNATQYSLECIGYGSDQWVLGNKISEDCLTLNVIRPSGLTGEALPVAVWIHGGGFFEGGSADPRYNLSYIVQQSSKMNTPFIGVSINYRLQAWGFIFGKEIAEEGSTNLGIRDQRLALHWVQENIAAFGGDPTKVTIWGESAGGFSVGAHLVAYGGRDDGCEYIFSKLSLARDWFQEFRLFPHKETSS
jgi:cholinesterase